jgi:hypothetical protein
MITKKADLSQRSHWPRKGETPSRIIQKKHRCSTWAGAENNRDEDTGGRIRHISDFFYFIHAFSFTLIKQNKLSIGKALVGKWLARVFFLSLTHKSIGSAPIVLCSFNVP